jgi:CDP-glucose 4,6-dehydratase
VEDGAAAYMILAEKLAIVPKLRGEAFNISVEQPVSVLEIVNRILSIMGSSLKPDVRNEANYEIRNQYLNASKAKELLNWKPVFDIDSGLRKTVQWYKDFFINNDLKPVQNGKK